MQEQAERVVIGMDPHKRSATIEVMTADETILGGGRYGTDEAGFAAMTDYVNRLQPQVEDRVWAVEGCNGIGHHIAMRLLAAGEQVIDVPPKLSARARVFATGQGRKTDATDAHSVSLVGTRMAGPRPVVNDEQLAVLRVLVDRRRSLGEDHTRMVSQATFEQGKLLSSRVLPRLPEDRKGVVWAVLLRHNEKAHVAKSPWAPRR